MTNRASYVVTLSHDEQDPWWIAQGSEPGCVTQGRTLARAQERAREMLAAWYDVDEDSFDVVWRFDLGNDLTRQLDQLARDRDLLQSTHESVGRRVAATLEELVRERGLSQRDAAIIVGLSHQRVGQLLGEHT